MTPKYVNVINLTPLSIMSGYTYLRTNQIQSEPEDLEVHLLIIY